MDAGIGWVQSLRLPKEIQGLGVSTLLEKIAGYGPELAERSDRVSQLDARSHGRPPRVEVAGVECPQADSHFRGAAHVSARQAALDDRSQIRARVDQDSLPGRQLPRLE